MRYRQLHGWDVTPEEAIRIQKELRSKLTFASDRGDFNLIAGVDVSYDKDSDDIYAAVVVIDIRTFRVLEAADAEYKAKFPYIPGLLSFRESPAVIRAWEKLNTLPDCLMCDGQGLAHPRRFGIACHLGMIFDLPAIGCAKSLLVGRYTEPALSRGNFTPLVDKGEQVGVVLRTKDNVEPVFVSQGYKISLERAIDVVLRSTSKYRIPEPTRQAHLLVNEVRQKAKQTKAGGPKQQSLF